MPVFKRNFAFFLGMGDYLSIILGMGGFERSVATLENISEVFVFASAVPSQIVQSVAQYHERCQRS